MSIQVQIHMPISRGSLCPGGVQFPTLDSSSYSANYFYQRVALRAPLINMPYGHSPRRRRRREGEEFWETFVMNAVRGDFWSSWTTQNATEGSPRPYCPTTRWSTGPLPSCCLKTSTKKNALFQMHGRVVQVNKVTHKDSIWFKAHKELFSSYVSTENPWDHWRDGSLFCRSSLKPFDARIDKLTSTDGICRLFRHQNRRRRLTARRKAFSSPSSTATGF